MSDKLNTRRREFLELNLEIYAKAYILLEKGWTQRTFARDKEGNEVASHSPEATSFCLVGAFRAVSVQKDFDKAPDEIYEHATQYSLEPLGIATKGWDISGWNDKSYRTHEEVLAVMRAAIAVIEQQIAALPVK